MSVMVPMPREKWTDERLDDLSKKVDDGFARLDGDIRELRGELKEMRTELKQQGDSLRGEIKAQGDSLRAEMAEMNARFEALNRNMIAGLFMIVAAIIGSNAL